MSHIIIKRGKTTLNSIVMERGGNKVCGGNKNFNPNPFFYCKKQTTVNFGPINLLILNHQNTLLCMLQF